MSLTTSIVLPTYRGAAHLPAQLASLAGQDERPGELVVTDDASPDETVEVVERFARDAPFPVRVTRQAANVGVVENVSRGVAAATGDVVLLCDQDDAWKPHKVRTLVAPLRANADIVLAFADAELADEALRPTSVKLSEHTGLAGNAARFARDPFAFLLKRNRANGASMAFRRSVVLPALPVPSAWLHDAYLALVLAAVGDVVYVDEPLMLYRQHARQVVGVADEGVVPTLRHGAAGVRHHVRMVEQARALADALAKLPGVKPRAARFARDRLALSEARLRMRSRLRPVALAMIARELVSGRYHRAARGFATAGADVLAR